ncbi:MAG: hypothetical protein HY681_01850 [Chloroflexi bacterium]|nr:hypothetical protein [Chloroflexota bacterium]
MTTMSLAPIAEDLARVLRAFHEYGESIAPDDEEEARTIAVLLFDRWMKGQRFKALMSFYGATFPVRDV